MESDNSKMRVHWFTWLVVLTMGGLFVFCQFIGKGPTRRRVVLQFECGWPYKAIQVIEQRPNWHSYLINVKGLAVNLGLFVPALLSVAFATERCRRSVADRFRMHLGTLFSVTTVVAVLVAGIIHRQALQKRFEHGSFGLEMNEMVIHLYPWLWIFMVFAEICMLYTIAWLIARGCAKMIQTLSGSHRSDLSNLS